MRALIVAAEPEMTEEWKWNVPVWSHNGIVCTGESFSLGRFSLRLRRFFCMGDLQQLWQPGPVSCSWQAAVTSEIAARVFAGPTDWGVY